MIDPLSNMQLVLGEAGFETRLSAIEGIKVVCFEDEVVTGFGCSFKDPTTLLAQWKSTEMSLLTRYAPSLRAAGEKAWNVYSIFLCTAPANRSQNRQVCWIEENLERTRKIVGCGLASREDVVRALLPLLPLQFRPVLGPEDVTERLQARIRTIEPRVSDVALDRSVPAMEVVRLLGGTA
jgi:hypothetical protein